MVHTPGPLLTIDLTEQTTETTDIDDRLEEFIGGRGIATKLAHDRIPFDADPLGPNNRLYISTGPLQVSQMSFTGRMNATGLSPLTGGLLSSNAGGYLSRNFAETGYSVVEVIGESDELIAVHVTDDGISFEEVPELEQATVPEVTGYMERNHDLESQHLVTIGPAGENLVRYASIMTFDSRAFGRGGLGTILGAKNVKCITFDGDSQPNLGLPNDVEMSVHQDAATADDMFKRQGTTSGTEFINDNFSLPTRYYEEYSFEHVNEIDGDAVEEKKYEKGACSQCAFACKLPTRDEATGLETEGPEFETVYSFGSNCAVDDIVDVMQSNELCDVHGMDTISTGNTIAAYLEANDEFGNADLIHDLIEKIARREGVGDMLAEGIHRSADELGVEDWTVKGMEFAAHDGRVINGQGLSYAVANRGADHLYSVLLEHEYDYEIDPEGVEGKAPRLIREENKMALRDSAIFCEFSRGYLSEDQIEQLLDRDIEDLLEIGSRVVELERHFNNNRGFDSSDDRLPYDLPNIQEEIARYYDLRGWNSDGTVPEERFNQQSTAD